MGSGKREVRDVRGVVVDALAGDGEAGGDEGGEEGGACDGADVAGFGGAAGEEYGYWLEGVRKGMETDEDR